MKHVFGASSHLVFYLCNKIVEQDGLNPDDCIFFFTRDYHCPQKYDDVYKNIINTGYNVDEKKGRVFEGLHFRKTKQNIKDFDTLVDSFLNGEEFIWYSQICNNDFCSLFVSKPNCKGYYVLEDGLGSYRQFNPQTFTGAKYLLYKFVLKPFWPRCFEVKNHFITTDHPKFKGCIATTDYCFPLHQQYLRCVGLPFETIDLGFKPDAVISIDPIYLWIEEKYEDLVYERLSHFIVSQHYSCIAYKFHPYFFAKSNADIKQRFDKLIEKHYGDSMIELSADISLENVLMTYHSDFFTDNSSIAVYGHAMNAKCYTYMPILREYTDAYNNVPLIEKFCIPIY